MPLTQIPDLAHSVGPGWQPLLARAHQQLCALSPDYVLNDLKEKFGGLRIHIETEQYDGSALRAVIAAAEEESEHTCEFCGERGCVRSRGDWPGGWRKCVCEACHQEWSAHRILIVRGVVREQRG
ncbi:hypothetical protein [Streptomyces spinosirectus]